MGALTKLLFPSRKAVISLVRSGAPAGRPAGTHAPLHKQSSSRQDHGSPVNTSGSGKVTGSGHRCSTVADCSHGVHASVSNNVALSQRCRNPITSETPDLYSSLLMAYLVALVFTAAKGAVASSLCL